MLCCGVFLRNMLQKLQITEFGVVLFKNLEEIGIILLTEYERKSLISFWTAPNLSEYKSIVINLSVFAANNMPRTNGKLPTTLGLNQFTRFGWDMVIKTSWCFSIGFLYFCNILIFRFIWPVDLIDTDNCWVHKKNNGRRKSKPFEKTEHIFYMSYQNGITQGFYIRRNNYALIWNGSGFFGEFHFHIF